MTGSTVQRRKKAKEPEEVVRFQMRNLNLMITFKLELDLVIDDTTMQELLDEQEQEALIASLQREWALQAQQSKKFVGGLGALVVLIYLFLAYEQAVRPWTLQHQVPFKGILDPGSVVVGELGAALTVAVSTMAVWTFGRAQDDLRWRKALTYGVTLALFLFGFWSMAIFKVMNRGGFEVSLLWRIIWKPLAPGMCVAAAVSAIDGLHSMINELTKLRASTYLHKKA